MVSLASTMRFAHIVKGTKKSIMGIIVNRIGKRHDIQKDEIESVITERIMGYIPEDNNITISNTLHKAVLDYNPFAPSSIEIMDMCSKMLGKDYKRPGLIKIRNFFSQWWVKK